MSEGNMTGRPAGGVNERPDQIPGEKPEEDLVGPPSQAEEPRAAQGGTIGTEDPSVPHRSSQPPPGDTGS
ncbi:hypothetical protein ACI782_07100 [Geodermatophilus sp. SYSU D00703]